MKTKLDAGKVIDEADKAYVSGNAASLDMAIAKLYTLAKQQRDRIRELENTWQPIENLPDDVDDVLLFGESAGEIHGPSGVQEFLGVGRRANRTDYPRFNWLLDMSDAYAVWAKPTYWMHKPKGPS